MNKTESLDFTALILKLRKNKIRGKSGGGTHNNTKLYAEGERYHMNRPAAQDASDKDLTRTTYSNKNKNEIYMHVYI